MKKIALILLCFVLLPLAGCSGPYTIYYSTDISKYDRYVAKKYADYFMPKMENLDGYEAINLFCTSFTINLILTFSEENYEEYKQQALENYEFLTEPVKYYDRTYGSEKELFRIPQVEFEHYGYTIKVVDNEEFTYGKYFGMIGYSDPEYKICYLYFRDTSGEIISDMLWLLDKAFVFSEDDAVKKDSLQFYRGKPVKDW